MIDIDPVDLKILKLLKKDGIIAYILPRISTSVFILLDCFVWCFYQVMNYLTGTEISLK